MSDNNISRVAQTHLMMVFGIKDTGGEADLDCMSAAMDAPIPRTMTTRQLEMQRIEEQMTAMAGHTVEEDVRRSTEGDRGKQQKNQIVKSLIDPKDTRVNSYEQATAQIANAEQIKNMMQQKAYVQSCYKQGIGRQQPCLQPVVFSRKLGHSELIYSETSEKNTYFVENAATKWIKMPRDECWICEQWKYCVFFFNRSDVFNKKFYQQITDPAQIEQIEEQYQLNEDDLVLTKEDKNPLIFGSITRNIVSAMIDADVFSIFLDSNEMKKDFGDKKDAVVANLL